MVMRMVNFIEGCTEGSEFSEEMREFDRDKKWAKRTPGLVSGRFARQRHSEPPRKFHTFPKNGGK